MTQKKKNIPELRFPEFVNEGEWEEKKLIDTTDKKVKWSFTGGPFGSNLKASDYTTEGIRIIQLQNIGDGEFNDGYKIYTSESKADELISCNIYSGEIILSKMGDPVGRACVIPDFLKRCVMASDGIRLVVDEKKISKYFIYSLINSKHIREAIEKKATGSTRRRIGLEELKGVKLIVPKKLEQQKIASCLSSLDEVIAANSQKLELLKNHKKGLMQNLFPQDGEKVPKYRFKEFENDGEWVEKKLGKVFTIFQGFAFSSSDSVDEGARWLKIADVSLQHMNHDTPSFLPLEYKEKYINFLVKKGDYVIALTRPMLGKELKISQVDDVYHESLLNQRVGKLVSKQSLDFVYYLLQTFRLISTIEKNIAGNEPPNLSIQQIKDNTIFIPSKPKEQQKIASCLSALDELITAQVEKIKQLKQHKKGLMQGLFPKMNE